MIEVYYPRKTENIWHFGKEGNKYRLDSLNRMVLLKDRLDRLKSFRIHQVNRKEDSILQLAASSKLLKAFKTGKPASLANSSGVLWQRDFYQWLVNSAWSHILAAQTALRKGSGFALADGAHHAQTNSGFGFGPLNNLVLTAKYLTRNKLLEKVAILDVDVHYGNGTHSQVVGNKHIFSADVWRYKLEKWRFTESGGNISHIRVNTAEQYFRSLPRLFKQIRSFHPELLIIYFGLDVLESDRMGGIKNFGKSEVYRRNEIIRRFIKETSIPVLFSVGGGYVDYSKSKRKVGRQQQQITDLFLRSANDLLS
jgi:acetoin utilization deacetylase AcuC-like enzyme